MKKLLLVIAPALLLLSCGSKTDKKEAKSGDQVSAEMKAFIGKFDGKGTTVEAALKEYGKEGLVTSDMEMYDLKDPEILETKGNCYLLESKSGITKRKYNICWEAGKISSVEDKGME